MTSIEVKNIGPVTEFCYELDEPGLHILRGRQGAGKTTVLRTVQLATDGRTDSKPTKRDGTPGGEAHVAGKTLKISRTTRQEGELTVDGLGDLDIAALHTPKFQTPETRDEHRIRTLARLAGVEADPAMFFELVGGVEQFNTFTSPETRTASDLVEMAARLKRDLEARARAEKNLEDAANATVQAQRAQFEGINLDQPADERALSAAHSEAVAAKITLVEKRKAALEVLKRAGESRANLELIDAINLDAAEENHENAMHAVAKLEADVDRLRSALAAAEAVLQQKITLAEAAAQRLEDAKRQAAILEAWQRDVQAAQSVECPSAEDIEAAEAAVSAAASAMEQGRRVRAAIAAKDGAAEYARKARYHSDQATRLRDMARGTMDVLSDSIAQIPDCPLRVQTDDDGKVRLVLKTDRSDAEMFDELSDGERWNVLIPIAARRNRLLVLPQAAFGELSPSSRRQIHEVAHRIGCYILTASADDGELRAEMFEAGQ